MPERDQRQRGRFLGGNVPFGWQVGHDDKGKSVRLMPVPEKQRAIRRMRRLQPEVPP
jgi:hypothetical protein